MLLAVFSGLARTPAGAAHLVLLLSAVHGQNALSTSMSKVESLR